MGLVVCVCLLQQPAALGADAGSPGNSAIGTNLRPIRHYSSEIPFVDIYKMSRERKRNDTEEADSDDPDDQLETEGAHTAPEPGAKIRMLSGVSPHYATGQYTVLYDGEGKFSYGGAATLLSSEASHDFIDVRHRGTGIIMNLEATNRQNPLRNVRVIPPGGICGDDVFSYCTGNEDCQEAQCNEYTRMPAPPMFDPYFLKSLDGYRAVRFSNWMEANKIVQTSWDDRPTMNDARWSTPKGVPVEIMVDLANLLDADPWFVFPVTVNDEYLEEFARFVVEELEPDLSVYVEYGNEVWNRRFESTRWVLKQALAEWPGDKDGRTKLMSWYGRRSVELCQTWKAVWTTDKDRIRCVVSAQAAAPLTAESALECPYWDGGPCYSRGIDTLAIAPYFGGYIGSKKNLSVLEEMAESPEGIDLLFREINSGGVVANSPEGGALEEALRNMKAYSSIASRYNLRLAAYEGGQHIVGRGKTKRNDAINNLFIGANRNPRMHTAYTKYLGYWRTIGGELFMHYYNLGMYTLHGSWGATEFQDELESPKREALFDFIRENPCWWTGCVRGN